MRVLLVACNSCREPYPVYPLGMAVLAAALEAAGRRVAQYDLLAEGWDLDALRGRVRDFDPQCVGLSVRNLDNVDSLSAGRGWFADQAREAVRAVRAATAAPVVVGGAGFSLMPDLVLDHLGADYGIAGEGEEAFPALLATLEQGGTPPRISGGGKPCGPGAAMPPARFIPDYVRFYQGESGLMGVQTKRGCPNACAYCAYPLIEGRTVRCRDPREVAGELVRLRREHGVDTVFFTDAVFNDAGGRYLELAEELARNPAGVRWLAYFQPRGMDRRTLRLLRRSGLMGLEVGADAASDATLAGLGKGFSFAQVADFNALCVSEGLPCAHFVIFGGPGETPDTVEEGLRNLDRLDPAVVFAFSGIRVHPRTRLHELALAQGVLRPDADLLRPVFYHAPGLDPEALNARLAQAFARRRDRIFPPERGYERMAVLHRLGFRGVLWDTLIRLPAPAAAGAPS
ncbi:MAG: lipid biosynthesis B12-binding/radical SAM protein [Thermodesulfobacteriota bacterium]